MMLLENSEIRSWTGSGHARHNEDYACIHESSGTMVLIDGATGLTKANIVVGTSDAAWYAQRLAERCALYLGMDVRLQDALRRAGSEVAEEYLAFPGAETLQRIDMPNGSLAAARWSGANLEIAMLGDCYAVVETLDGTWELIHDDTLDKLDQLNYDRMYDYATSRKVSMAEARIALNDCFKANRLRMNEENGYWAADISCRGFGHELTKTFVRGSVRSVFVCTDGYAAAVAMGVAKDVVSIAQGVARGEGERIGELLRKAERKDKLCLRVPRSKPSDDATYAFASFMADKD